MKIIFEGHLSYDVPLKKVLEEVIESPYRGPAILRITDPLSSTSGDIQIVDGQIVAARMKNPELDGYRALRSLCALTLADFRFLESDELEANELQSNEARAPGLALDLEIKQILKLVPNLPEEYTSFVNKPSGKTGNNHGAEGQVKAEERSFSTAEDAPATETEGGQKIRRRAANPFTSPGGSFTYLIGTTAAWVKKSFPLILLPVLLVVVVAEAISYFKTQERALHPQKNGLQTPHRLPRRSHAH